MMFTDLTGKRFGRLLVLKRSEQKAGRERLWDCACDCGKTKAIRSGLLRKGSTRSCGCLHSEVMRARATHGATTGGKTKPEYRIWGAMIRRCESPSDTRFKDYGERGISVCGRWRSNYAYFITDMGPRPKGYTIERKENDGNYEPNNCVWAPLIRQANNKRNTSWVVFHGSKMSLADAAREAGVDYHWLFHRFKTCGMPFEQAINPSSELRR